jgi:hypothetical protein
MFKPVLLFFIFSFVFHFSFAQLNTNIDFNKIESSCVKSYLHKNHLNTSKDLNDIQPSCYSQNKDFSKHQKSYIFDFSLQNVWDAYLNVSATDAWKNKRSKIELLFNKNDQKCCYKQEKMEGLKVGQMMFIKLKIFAGLVKLPVAHQVLELNKEELYMKFCYVEFGKSKGTQLLKFSSLPNGHTQVEHITYYKSDSKFRDKKLYPHIHQKIISEYHKNMKKQIRKNTDHIIAINHTMEPNS